MYSQDNRLAMGNPLSDTLAKLVLDKIMEKSISIYKDMSMFIPNN